MKKMLFGLFMSASVMAQAAPSFFNHTAAKPNYRHDICDRSPCIATKVTGFKLVEKTPTESTILVNILGGNKYPNGKVKWNNQSHRYALTCSKTHPTIQVDDEDTDNLPLHPNTGMDSILAHRAILYMQLCHSYTGDLDKGIKKFGYNVR